LANARQTDGNTASETEILRKELLMPTDLILIGGILVVAAGGFVFVLLRRQKADETPHFR
jgi:hypothetical protein